MQPLTLACRLLAVCAAMMLGAPSALAAENTDCTSPLRIEFVQPDPNAVSLIRLTRSSTKPTEILGSLAANGRLVILAPNGIVFGPTARVEVGSLFSICACAVGPLAVSDDVVSVPLGWWSGGLAVPLSHLALLNGSR